VIAESRGEFDEIHDPFALGGSAACAIRSAITPRKRFRRARRSRT